MPIKTGKLNGCLWLYDIEKRRFDLTKTINDWTCLMCRQKISKGSFCLGRGSAKTCLNCTNKTFKNYLKSLEELGNKILKIKKDLKKNKSIYLKNNVYSAI